MKIFALLLSSLLSSLIDTVWAYDIIKEREGIINDINKERAKHDLSPVIFNYSLMHELNSFDWVLRETNNSNWWFEDRNESIVYEHRGIRNVTNRLNGAFLMNDPKFKKYGDDGWTYGFRDSYEYDWRRIIKMRLDQRNCLSHEKCNDSVFNHFTTCCVTCALEDRKYCSYANSYYPWMMLKSLTEISYVRLDIQGKYTPVGLLNKQKRCAWMFLKHGNITSDRFLEN